MDVKRAVAAAVAFAKDVLEPKRANDMLLEEVELSHQNDGHEVWLITLSFPKDPTLRDLMTNARDYKMFTVDAETGQVQAMKIRELATSH